MGNAKTGSNFRGLGVDISFPFEPYGIQKAMLNKITSTLINKEHSLIESPTGTGKTLVLLCSTLAWQQKSKLMQQPFLSDRMKKTLATERRQNLLKKPCTCGRRPNQDDEEFDDLKKEKGEKKGQFDDLKKEKDEKKGQFDDLKKGKDEKMGQFNELDKKPIQSSEHHEFDDDDDIQIIDEIKKLSPECKPKQVDDIGPICLSCRALQAEETFNEILNENSTDEDFFISTKVTNKIPRIYYGTRTHKQISQVIRELNKTSYSKGLRICILSSRERTCIHEDVRDDVNRNDKCRDLLKNGKSVAGSKRKRESDGCPYHPDPNSVATVFEEINTEFDDRVWDIEDAAKFGRERMSCPYFGARSLQERADITFSPYNYLLDPIIRNNLNINLSNSIVIFDEAHNIEDICRESASFTIDTKQLEDIVSTIQVASSNYVQGTSISEAYNYFRNKLHDLRIFLLNYQFLDPPATREDHLHKKIMDKNELINTMKYLKLYSADLPEFKEQLKALRGDEEDDEKSNKSSNDTQQPALSFNQMQFISQLSLTLNFMYDSSCKYLDDFRLVVTKSLDRGDRPTAKHNYNQIEDDRFSEKYLWQFSLLCMNSGIAFERIHSLAWSVIVASGTLSPIESLKTELGCKFSNVFEGSHVIKEDRIFASIVSQGPRNVDLNCAWNNSLHLDFQDEVGLVIKDICVAVPNGVLVFFPSYDRMENLYNRWFTKGIISDINKAGKRLFREQKRMTADAFEMELQKYNKNAKKSGALLFAVFRGKVSEGIDFADESARAVVTIGIPYPNIKETNVGLKRDYNDVARRSRPHLMPGGEWYAAQAFRALNQALGRCIRHKEDWGAIIMIDSRLIMTHSQSKISKWLRRNLQTANDYKVMHRNLQGFVQTRLTN